MSYLQKRVRIGLIGRVVRAGLVTVLSLGMALWFGFLFGDDVDSEEGRSTYFLRIGVDIFAFILGVVGLVGSIRILVTETKAILHPDLLGLSFGPDDISLHVAEIEHASSSLGRFRNLDVFKNCLVAQIEGRFVIFPHASLKTVAIKEATGEEEGGGLEVILFAEGGFAFSVMELNIYDYTSMRALADFFAEHFAGVEITLDEFARERFEFGEVAV